MKVFIKVMCSIICVGILFVVIGISTGAKLNYSFFEHKITIDDSKTEKFSKNLSDFNKINIDVDYSNKIEIIEGDENKIDLSYYKIKNKPNLEYSIENNELTIKSNHIKSFINFVPSTNNKQFIKVYVKKGTEIENLKISSDCSDVSISNINSKTINVNCDYGDISVNNIKNLDSLILDANAGNINTSDLSSNSIQMTNDYGDVTLSNINCPEININVDCGDVNIDNSVLNKSTIDNSYGDVTITNLPETEDYYNYKLKCDFGDVSINGQNIDNDYTKINTNDENIIKISNNCGDIDINTK